MEKVVYQFLELWLKWVDKGAKKNSVLHRYYGLCDNMKSHLVFTDGGDRLAAHRVLGEMFLEDGLCNVFPFNDLDGYGDEVRCRACHTNLIRVQWVRERVARGKQEGFI